MSSADTFPTRRRGAAGLAAAAAAAVVVPVVAAATLGRTGDETSALAFLATILAVSLFGVRAAARRRDTETVEV